MAENNKKIRIKDIAKLANVSIATVDRVLNNRKDVSDTTRKKINDIIKKYNYTPNVHARSLSVKNKLKFAVLIPKTSKETGYWQLCLDGVNKGAKELEPFGIKTIVYLYNQESKDSFEEKAQEILKSDFNAIVIAPIFIKESALFIKECHKRKMQSIYINSDIEEKTTLGYIGPDLYTTGRLAGNLTSYITSEKSKILILSIAKGLENYKYIETKVNGFIDYLKEQKKQQIIEVLDIPYNSFNEIEPILLKTIKEHAPEVIFVTNSRVAILGQFYEMHSNQKKPFIIGFDFLENNVKYLATGIIDFLICQRPDQQGYLALKNLYKYFLSNKKMKIFKPMPIDIITIENYLFYEN